MAAVASNVQFLNDFLMKFDSAVVNYWQNLVSTVVEAVSPVATSLLGIYIVIWGWAMLRGHIQEPVTDGLGRMIRLSMIVSVALSVGYYNMVLSSWISATPDYLAGLGASGGGGTASSLVQYADQVAEQLLNAWDAMGKAVAATGWTTVLSAMPTLVVGVVMFVAILLLLIYIVFLLVLSKMAIAVLIGVGPLFVLSLIFESSKNWFSMWWAQVLNFSFLALLAGASGALVLRFMMQYLTAADLPTAISSGQGFTSAMVPPIAFAGIGSLLLMQAPSMASGLAGGVALSTLNAFGQSVGGTYGRMTGMGRNMMRSGWRHGTGQSISDLRSTRRIKMANRAWAHNNRGKGWMPNIF
jgi:type IV secretion system protein VirB6